MGMTKTLSHAWLSPPIAGKTACGSANWPFLYNGTSADISACKTNLPF